MGAARSLPEQVRSLRSKAAWTWRIGLMVAGLLILATVARVLPTWGVLVLVIYMLVLVIVAWAKWSTYLHAWERLYLIVPDLEPADRATGGAALASGLQTEGKRYQVRTRNGGWRGSRPSWLWINSWGIRLKVSLRPPVDMPWSDIASVEPIVLYLLDGSKGGGDLPYVRVVTRNPADAYAIFVSQRASSTAALTDLLRHIAPR
jgi:hypothetical protein